jgi:hypothetical protein
MRYHVTVILSALALATTLHAATPVQEKQFVDTYRKAYEAKDGKTLESLLYTKGADPMALGFYKMMLTAEMGGRIASIQLLALTPDDKARSETGKSPDGRPMKLVMPATRKLVVKTEAKDKNGSSSGSSEVFVGESDGRLYILVPAVGK